MLDDEITTTTTTNQAATEVAPSLQNPYSTPYNNENHGKDGPSAQKKTTTTEKVDSSDLTEAASKESSIEGAGVINEASTEPASQFEIAEIEENDGQLNPAEESKTEVVAAAQTQQQDEMEEQKFEIKMDTEENPPPIVTFATSHLPVDSQLTAYLSELLQDPYNKWCLDCKVNQSTHAIVTFGIFVCETCAINHVTFFGRSATWPKRVLAEHWDDYQLMHVARGCGGNKPLYSLFQEYGIESCELKEKYSSKAFLWYKVKHQSLCDGTLYEEAKPAKNLSEAWQRTKDISKNTATKVSTKTSNLVDRVDQKLLSSNTFGRMWRKMKGKGPEEPHQEDGKGDDWETRRTDLLEEKQPELIGAAAGDDNDSDEEQLEDANSGSLLDRFTSSSDKKSPAMSHDDL